MFEIAPDASIPTASSAPPTTFKNPSANPPRKERMALNPLMKKFFTSSTAAVKKSQAPAKSPLNNATMALTTLVTKDTKLENALVNGVNAASTPWKAPTHSAKNTVAITSAIFRITFKIGWAAT